MPIFWKHADGSLAQTVLTDSFLEQERLPEETTAQAVERLARDHVQQKNPALKDCELFLVKSAGVPADRSKRYAWRLNGTGKVAVDATVPAPPHPKQALLDQVKAAGTMDELKTILGEIIRG